MSWKVMNALVRMPILPPTRKLVAIRMAMYAGEDFSCFPGIRSLARDCGISECVARTHIKALQESGIIVSTPRFDSAGRQTSNLYRFNPRVLGPVAMEEAKEMIDEGNRNPIFVNPQKSDTEFAGYHSKKGHGSGDGIAWVGIAGNRGVGIAGNRGVGIAGNTPSESSEVNTTKEEETPVVPRGDVFVEEPDIDPSEAASDQGPPPVPPPPSENRRQTELRVAALAVISELNRSAGRAFRAVDSHLKPIIARLSEPGVTPPEVLKMVRRQIAIWGPDPKMRQYLTPTTLFRPSNFARYYDDRDLAVPRGPARTSDALPGMIREPNLRPKMINLNPSTP